MLIKCNCNNCSTHLEFESENAGQVITCPTCGMETTLYVPPPSPAPKPAAPDTPRRQKSSVKTVLRIIAALFVVAAAFAAYKWQRNNTENFNKDMDVRAAENAESIGNTAKATKEATAEGIKGAAEFEAHLRSLGGSGKKAAEQKPVFPPPPASGMEFSTKLLENFQERVIDKKGWIDGEFLGINNDSIEGDNLLDTRSSVGFFISDRNGNIFLNCYANKAEWGGFFT